MNRRGLRALAASVRVISLVLLAAVGTMALTRLAPGYFADEREMDPRYGAAGRQAVETRQQNDPSLRAMMTTRIRAGFGGDLGRSRQYDVPVTELLKERSATSLKLLVEGVVCGWALAFSLAVGLSGRRARGGEVIIAAPAALLLAVPVGAMATVCLLTDVGGPLLVLATLIAVRDFKLLYRLLRRTWRAPHLLYARAAGVPRWRIASAHLLPSLAREMFALMMTSVVVALSLLVPVEVIFDVPGLGHLAWSAAMNRDLPVLLAVTLLMAGCVGVAAALTDPARAAETIACA